MQLHKVVDREHGVPWDDTRPAPGGVEGVPTDYRRWYPPDTPFGWGQGFPVPFTNAANFGGRWPADGTWIPSSNYVYPYGVPLMSHLYPAAYGSDGRFQQQLLGVTPTPTGEALSQLMIARGAAQASLPPAPMNNLAGAFARSGADFDLALPAGQQLGQIGTIQPKVGTGPGARLSRPASLESLFGAFGRSGAS